MVQYPMETTNFVYLLYQSAYGIASRHVQRWSRVNYQGAHRPGRTGAVKVTTKGMCARHHKNIQTFSMDVSMDVMMTESPLCSEQACDGTRDALFRGTSPETLALMSCHVPSNRSLQWAQQQGLHQSGRCRTPRSGASVVHAATRDTITHSHAPERHEYQT